MATTPFVNGQTFAQASQGITDRGQLGALAQKFQATTTPVPTTTVSPTTNTGVIGTKPVTIRPQAPSTLATGINEASSLLSKSYEAQRQEEITQRQAQQQQDQADISGAFNELAGMGAAQEQLYQDAGVDQIKKQSRELQNQIDSEQAATRRRVEELRRNSKGLLGGTEAEIRKIEYNTALDTTEKMIQKAFIDGNYNDAVAAADRQIALKTEAVKTRLEGLKFFYEDNKDSLTKQQDRQYNEALFKAQSDYEQKLQLETMRAKAKLDKASGIPFQTPSVINPMTGKADPSGQLAYVIAGSGAKDNQTLQAINGVVAAAQQFADNNQSGNFPGLGLVRPGRFTIGAQGTQNQGAIEAINLRVQQWASGASLTKEQIEQVKKLTPKVNDTDKQARNKTNSLTNFMLSQAQGQLASQGIVYTPPQVNFFSNISSTSNKDLLNSIPSMQGGNTNSNFFSSF